MKSMKNMVLAVVAALSLDANAGNVSGGGGGGTLPASPVSNWRIYQIITHAKIDLRLFLKSQQYDYGLYSSGALDQKLFGGDRTLYDALESTDIEIRMDGPCFDANQQPVDGSIHATKPGDICISAASMAPKLIEERAYTETLALILHELAHTLGADEKEASEYQQWAAYHIKAHNEHQAERIAREAYNFATSVGQRLDKLSRIATTLNNPETLELAQNIFEDLQKHNALSDPNYPIFRLYNYSETSWLDLQDVRLWLIVTYLDGNPMGRASYDNAFRGLDEIAFKDLDWPLFEPNKNPFGDTVIRRVKTEDDLKRELLDLASYFNKERSRIYGLFLGTSSPAEPNYPHPIKENPWKNFIGHYAVTTMNCQKDGITSNPNDSLSFEIFENNNLVQMKTFAAHSSGTDGLYNGGILSPIPAEVRVDGDQNHAIAMVEQGDRWGENTPWTKKSLELSRTSTGFTLTDTYRNQRRSASGKVESWSSCTYQLTLQ